MSASASIACFGAAHIDITARVTGEFIVGVSNPVVSSRSPGGVARNVAAGLAHLGHRVSLVTALGCDATGDEVRAALESDQIETSGIIRSMACDTASYTAVLDSEGELLLGLADTAIYDALTPDLMAPHAEAALGADCWVIDANLPEPAIAALVACAGGRVPLAGMAVSPAKVRRLVPHLASFETLFVNRSEASAVTGLETGRIEELCRAMAACGPSEVFLTMGADGAAAWDGGFVQRPVLASDVRDVNGAGDGFAAGAIHGLLARQSLEGALNTGLAAAAIVAGDRGANYAALSPDALAEMSPSA